MECPDIITLKVLEMSLQLQSSTLQMPGTSAQELELLELRFCVHSNKALSIAGLVSRYIIILIIDLQVPFITFMYLNTFSHI